MVVPLADGWKSLTINAFV